MEALTPLEQLRASQHDDRLTPSDVDLGDYLEHCDPEQVRWDRAAHMSRDEMRMLARQIGYPAQGGTA